MRLIDYSLLVNRGGAAVFLASIQGKDNNTKIKQVSVTVKATERKDCKVSHQLDEQGWIHFESEE